MGSDFGPGIPIGATLSRSLGIGIIKFESGSGMRGRGTGGVNPEKPGAAPVLTRAAGAGGFTLVELLVVIAIIGILATIIVAFILPKAQQSAFNQVNAELHQIETAIDTYHADFGAYPPDNPNRQNGGGGTQFYTWNVKQIDYLPPLYYELKGAVANMAKGGLTGTYGTNDTAISRADYVQYFGLAGPQNSSPASLKDYLTNLRPSQFKRLQGTTVYVLTCSIGTPPVDPSVDRNLNPWSYNSSNPTNNPASYDLFNTNIVVGAKSYTVGNWSK